VCWIISISHQAPSEQSQQPLIWRCCRCCCDTQVANQALIAVCSCKPGAQQPSSSHEIDDISALQQPQTDQEPQAAACDNPGGEANPSAAPPSFPEPTGSTPADRALVSVLVQLSEAELLLARWQLQDGKAQAGEEPQFPRVEGRDPGAVIAFLNASAAAGDQVCCQLSLGWWLLSLGKVQQHSLCISQVCWLLHLASVSTGSC
jgi:hypothetical protein